MHQFTMYKKRDIKFLKQMEWVGWHVKVYGISISSDKLPADLITAGCNVVLDHLPQPAVTEQRYGVGFLIIHQGAMANWFLLDWWETEDIMHHRVFSSPSDKSNDIRPVEDQSIMACVYELEVYSFERQAWIDTILSNAQGPDFEAYLQMRLDTGIEA